jgi:hypothetical protein
MARFEKRRRGLVAAHASQPMFVIAGLPVSHHTRAIEMLEGRFKHAIFKGIPAPLSDGALYSQKLVDQLIRAIGKFAVRRRTNGNAQPTPRSITLLYVPAPDEERILQSFDFALMSEPLVTLALYDDRYRLRRHDFDAISKALVAALAKAGPAQQALNEVVRRLSFASDNEGLLLPPRNFLAREHRLSDTFLEIRRGARAWTDRLIHLGPTDLDHEDVPNRVQRGQTRHVFVDSRGMAFFVAHPNAYDGPPREVEDPDDVNAILSALRSLYRFGGALAPGFHHDAQRDDGNILGGAQFECNEKGNIEGYGPYANVYPNDYVRVAGTK